MVVKRLPPATEVVDEEPYVYRQLKAPVLSGMTGAAFLAAYEGPLGYRIFKVVSPSSGVHQVLHELQVPERPLFQPQLPAAQDVAPEQSCVSVDAATPAGVLAGLQQQGFLAGLPAAATIAPAATSAATTAASEATTAAAAKASQGDESKQQAGEVASPVAVKEATRESDTSVTFHRPTVMDYVAAYQSGRTTPSQVAERLIDVIAKNNAYHGWFISTSADHIRFQAAASTERWAKGQPLSVLDGVPWAVKDMLAAVPYNKTTVGTTFAADLWPSVGNADVVQAMASVGAILLGKTTLHEIGLGVTGLNVRTGTARNPFNPSHFCGGSSSGSAACVAAGLCPIVLGTDGGGSIRIPSSFCGLVGLKTTAGRVSAEGAFKSDFTVAVSGPMAGTVQDAAIMYAAISGKGVPSKPLPIPPPELRLPKPLSGSMTAPPLAGMKAGIYWPWFNHAHGEVVVACNAAVKLLQAAGLQVQSVTLPELELLRVAHNVTILNEIFHNFQAVWEDPKQRAQFNLESRVSLASARFFTASDYIQAQRIRQRANTHFNRALQEVDVLISPATPCTAPVIPAGSLTRGYSDLGLTSLIMRYAQPANFLGLPAIALPVGKDSKGLPIGLQIMAKHWHEATLLRLAVVLEKALADEVTSSSAQIIGGETVAAATGDSAALAPSGAVPLGVGVTGTPQVWVNPLTGASNGLTL